MRIESFVLDREIVHKSEVGTRLVNGLRSEGS